MNECFTLTLFNFFGSWIWSFIFFAFIFRPPTHEQNKDDDDGDDDQSEDTSVIDDITLQEK